MNQGIPQITAKEFKAMQTSARDTQAEGLTLLDVREPWEIEFASVPGSVNIPMNLVPERLAELPKDSVIVVMCHHGGRSQSVAQYLAHHDFSKIYNLSGGIHAWSAEIDPTVPQY